ncbi:hypothetical protein [Methylibium sp.]|uniref:hypothetical protein n=1 Tax=Methylibium sp. TaxID=2067992 RepID=UPI001793F10E|nr:hypothetical protein [Methylibium sp.]MBA3588485.1 hypothetical protein [Methylibium sp.]
MQPSNPTDDADRETLLRVLLDLSERDSSWNDAADAILAAGFRPAPSAPTPPEAGGYSELVAQRRVAEEAFRERDVWKARVLREQKITEDMRKERDAALADAAALREVVRREADGARRVVAGACSSMEFPIDWWQRKLDRLNAALAAPAAKEGER